MMFVNVTRLKMNETHKAIAEILKKEKNWIDLQDETKQKELLIHLHRERSRDLADNFEKEAKEDLNRTEERFKEYKQKHEGFNKEQFLKEAGVK